MALLEEHRNTIYSYFVPHLGKEATQAMLSQFPARDVDEYVTKGDLAITEANLRAELHREMGALGDRLTNRMLTIAVLIVGLNASVNGIMLAAFT